MASTVFTDYSTPLVNAAWLNDVNNWTYNGITSGRLITTYDTSVSSAFGAYSCGGGLNYSDVGNLAALAGSVNTYVQVVAQNKTSGTTASANFNVSNDAGTSTTNYGEFGINSSAFAGSGSFNGAGNVYLAAASGKLVIGTYSNQPIVFVVAGNTVDSWTIDGTTGDLYGVQASTGMTTGFIKIPSAAGIPTGTPTTHTGRTPIYWDDTNKKFYVYSTSTPGWKQAVLVQEGTWTPVTPNLVFTGTPTYQGWYTQIDNRVFWELAITVAGGTTASTANTTYFTGLPGSALAKTTCTAIQDSGSVSLGVGLLDVGTTRVYTPTWVATASGIYVSGSYRVATP